MCLELPAQCERVRGEVPFFSPGGCLKGTPGAAVAATTASLEAFQRDFIARLRLIRSSCLSRGSIAPAGIPIETFGLAVSMGLPGTGARVAGTSKWVRSGRQEVMEPDRANL